MGNCIQGVAVHKHVHRLCDTSIRCGHYFSISATYLVKGYVHVVMMFLLPHPCSSITKYTDLKWTAAFVVSKLPVAWLLE